MRHESRGALGDRDRLPSCHMPYTCLCLFSLSCLPCVSAYVCVVRCLLGPFGTLLHLFEVIIQFALLFFRGGAAACAKLFLRLTIFKSFQAPLK